MEPVAVLAIQMSGLSQDIQALAGDLAQLRSEIECLRTELQAVIDRFLAEDPLMLQPGERAALEKSEQPGKAEGTGPLPGCSLAPISEVRFPTERARSS